MRLIIKSPRSGRLSQLAETCGPQCPQRLRQNAADVKAQENRASQRAFLREEERAWRLAFRCQRLEEPRQFLFTRDRREVFRTPVRLVLEDHELLIVRKGGAHLSRLLLERIRDATGEDLQLSLVWQSVFQKPQFHVQMTHQDDPLRSTLFKKLLASRERTKSKRPRGGFDLVSVPVGGAHVKLERSDAALHLCPPGRHEDYSAATKCSSGIPITV